MIAGVCAGIGEHLRIDPSFIRIFFVLLALADGVGVFVYLVLWLLLPSEATQRDQSLETTVRMNADELASRAREFGMDVSRGFEGAHPQLPLYIGGGLVFLGIAFLIDNLNLVWLSWLRYELFLPALLILAGVVLLVRRTQGD
jgi:phage shock protein PspC (stress-responsive transcriptional regulator)